MRKLSLLSLHNVADDVQSMQLLAACIAIGGCCTLAACCQLPLKRRYATHFLAPLALLLGSGPFVLPRQPGQLMRVFFAVIAPGEQPVAAYRLLHFQMQLEAVAAMLHCAPTQLSPQEKNAAIAEAAGAPQRVLHWLLSASQALQQALHTVLPEQPISSDAGTCRFALMVGQRCAMAELRVGEDQNSMLFHAKQTAVYPLPCEHRSIASHPCQLCRRAAPPPRPSWYAPAAIQCSCASIP